MACLIFTVIILILLIFTPWYRPTSKDLTVQKIWQTTAVQKQFGEPSTTYTVNHFLISYSYYGLSRLFSCEITDMSPFSPAHDCTNGCEVGDQITAEVFANQYNSSDCYVADIDGIFLFFIGYLTLVIAFFLGAVIVLGLSCCCVERFGCYKRTQKHSHPRVKTRTPTIPMEIFIK